MHKHLSIEKRIIYQSYEVQVIRMGCMKRRHVIAYDANALIKNYLLSLVTFN